MMEYNSENLYDVVVIGGGPAGLTAALYLARARYRVVVVEKDHFGGQITITSEVVNFPGIERISGADLTEAMRKQAQSFGAQFLLAEVDGLSLEGDVKMCIRDRLNVKPFSWRIRLQMEWKVPICICFSIRFLPGWSLSRLLISSAALFVKVTAVISWGSTFLSSSI